MELRICSHQWVDPDERLITKGTYAPIIGPMRRQMKPGKIYQCNNCDYVLVIPAARPTREDTPQ